jgi:hypothetical protein
MNYSALLQHERLKQQMLLEKLRVCEDRIKLFESLSSDTDEFDELIDRQVLSAQPNATELPVRAGDVGASATQTNVDSTNIPKVRSDSTWPKVIKAMGQTVVDLDDLERITKANSMATTRGSIRTLMMNLRKRGLVENVKPGVYKLTQLGIKFADSQKGESPASVVATNDNGGAFSVQSSPLTGH